MADADTTNDSTSSDGGERSERSVTPIYVGMALFAGGSILGATGLSGLFAEKWHWATWTAALGVVLAAIGCVLALGCAAKLPEASTEGERYGRYMIGLSFTLLVVGAANAAGMATLAVTGELASSAAALDQIFLEADRGNTEGIVGRCTAVRKEISAARLAIAAGEDQESTLSGAMLRRDIVCADADVVVRERNRALFFILSLSTVMAIFGALFFVVNKLRTKRDEVDGQRPQNKPPTSRPGTANDSSRAPEEASTPSEGSNRETSPSTDLRETTSADRASAPPDEEASNEDTGPPVGAPAHRDAPYEYFDPHKFWAGTFFRVGEAVLFTFTFFFVIWTYRTASLTWLPVAALFVGMLVKSGEAIVFGLGLRVLAAVEAFLPVGDIAPRRGRDAEARSTQRTSGSGS